MSKVSSPGAGTTFVQGIFFKCAHTCHYRSAVSERKGTQHQFCDQLCDIIYVFSALPWYACVSKCLKLLEVNYFFPLQLKVPEGRRNLNTTKINIVSLLGLHI